jgi:hypothetical protein
MSGQKKKLTRKRLNNALAQVYRENPSFFSNPPTKMSFFQHVYAGNIDDVKEFLEEPDFIVNTRDRNGNGCLFFAVDGAGGLPMVKLLIENGADINAMNFMGEVPIHILCRNLTQLTSNQFDILTYIIDQPNLILFPMFGRPLESVFLDAIDDIGSFQNWISNIEEHDPEAIQPDNRERLKREREAQDYLLAAYSQIESLSEIYVKYVRVLSQNQKDLSYFHVDTRMTGAQLKQYIQRQIYHDPFMNLDLLFARRVLDPAKTLAEQGVEDESTITYQVRLVSGSIRLGGRRKTHRKRRT